MGWPTNDFVSSAVRGFLRFQLWWTFRRVSWTGRWPPPLPDGPVIAYSNHHSYYDGHLAWLLFRHVLDRPTTLWMAHWDQFPFFGAVGAQPFPPNALQRRLATLRRTAQRFCDNPKTVLVYFPEGELHPPDGGVRRFDQNVPPRLGRLYSEATWWPYATHVSTSGDGNRTALVRGGRPHAPDGDERTRLVRQLRALHHEVPSSTRSLFTGAPSASEICDLSFATSFFERYL